VQAWAKELRAALDQRKDEFRPAKPGEAAELVVRIDSVAAGAGGAQVMNGALVMGKNARPFNLSYPGEPAPQAEKLARNLRKYAEQMAATAGRGPAGDVDQTPVRRPARSVFRSFPLLKTQAQAFGGSTQVLWPAAGDRPTGLADSALQGVEESAARRRRRGNLATVRPFDAFAAIQSRDRFHPSWRSSSPRFWRCPRREPDDRLVGREVGPHGDTQRESACPTADGTTADDGRFAVGRAITLR
jgi:hypothetical protein